MFQEILRIASQTFYKVFFYRVVTDRTNLWVFYGRITPDIYYQVGVTACSCFILVN